MSKYLINPALLLVLQLGCACVLVIASSPDELAGRGHVVLRELLIAAYPEVVSQGMYLQTCSYEPLDPSRAGQSSNSVYRVTADAPASHEGKMESCFDNSPQNPNRLFGSIYFDDNGLVSIFYGGDPSDGHSPTKSQAFEKVVQSHLEWSNADAYKALKAAGARFGPDDKRQFLESIQLERYEKALGHLTIRSVNFDQLTPGRDAATGSLLDWHVAAISSLAPGKIYRFTFEPFDGRLVLLRLADH